MLRLILLLVSSFFWLTTLSRDLTKRVVDFKHSHKELKQIVFKTLNGKYSISDSPDEFAYVRVTLVVSNEKKIAEYETQPNIRQDYSKEVLSIEQTTNSYDFLYEISVPEKIGLEITTDASPLVIKNLKNDISLNTNHKDVYLENIKSGMISVVSKSSKIVAKSCSAKFKFVTDNSDMELNILGGKLEIIAEKGEIKVNLSTEIPVEIVSKAADVIISIPKSAKYNCKFSSEDNILYDFKNIVFDGNISHKNLAGKLNGGGEVIKLTTTRGRIKVYNAQ